MPGLGSKIAPEPGQQDGGEARGGKTGSPSRKILACCPGCAAFLLPKPDISSIIYII